MTEMINLELPASSSLRVSQLCASLDLSRAQYYRHRQHSKAADQDGELRQEIRAIAADQPAYGYRRITAQLARNGRCANHKRVLKIMRKDGLLCLRPKAFISTTQSHHSFTIYPNLARTLIVERLNQLWVADITYVHLRHEVCYLAVILDAYSRRVIGWQIDTSLDAQLVVRPLKQALAARTIKADLMHHSDRGTQYASDAYTSLLKQHQIIISMSRTGNPYDNAKAERFFKTLKYEEIYLNDYDNLADARRSIGTFLNDVYNHERLHSKLGYVPPAEFEQSLTSKNPAPQLVSN